MAAGCGVNCDCNRGSKMKILNALISVVFLAGMISSSVSADDAFIGQFYGWNIEEGMLIVDDESFGYSAYTVIQEYGDEDERLSISKLSSGNWLRITFDYDGEKRMMTATKIEILPGENFANSLRDAED